MWTQKLAEQLARTAGTTAQAGTPHRQPQGLTQGIELGQGSAQASGHTQTRDRPDIGLGQPQPSAQEL